MSDIEKEHTCYNCKSRFLPTCDAKCFCCDFPDSYMWEGLSSVSGEETVNCDND